MFRCVIVILLLLLLPPVALGADCLDPQDFIQFGDIDDASSVQRAIDAATVGGCVEFERGKMYEYGGTGIALYTSDITIYSHGAVHNQVDFSISANTKNVQWFGGTINWDTARWAISVSGSHITFEDVEIKQSPNPSTGASIYFRDESVFCRFNRVNVVGGTAWQIEGNNHTIRDCSIEQLLDRDDGWVLKAATSDTYNIIIDGCTVKNTATGFAIGSLVRQPWEVRNVVVSNLCGVDVSNLIYLKPGLNPDGTKNGVVNGVTIMNSQVVTTNDNFRAGIHIAVYDNARLSNVLINGLVIRGRKPSSGASGNYCGIMIAADWLKDVRIKNVMIESTDTVFKIDHAIWLIHDGDIENVIIEDVTWRDVSTGVRDNANNPGFIVNP